MKYFYTLFLIFLSIGLYSQVRNFTVNLLPDSYPKVIKGLLVASTSEGEVFWMDTIPSGDRRKEFSYSFSTDSQQEICLTVFAQLRKREDSRIWLFNDASATTFVDIDSILIINSPCCFTQNNLGHSRSRMKLFIEGIRDLQNHQFMSGFGNEVKSKFLWNEKLTLSFEQSNQYDLYLLLNANEDSEMKYVYLAHDEIDGQTLHYEDLSGNLEQVIFPVRKPGDTRITLWVKSFYSDRYLGKYSVWEDYKDDSFSILLPTKDIPLEYIYSSSSEFNDLNYWKRYHQYFYKSDFPLPLKKIDPEKFKGSVLFESFDEVRIEKENPNQTISAQLEIMEKNAPIQNWRIKGMGKGNLKFQLPKLNMDGLKGFEFIKSGWRVSLKSFTLEETIDGVKYAVVYVL